MKKTGKNERPEIELYMYSLNQEFAVGKGHKTFLKDIKDVYHDAKGKSIVVKQTSLQNLNLRRADDWSVQWISNEWIKNYTYYPGAGLVSEGDPLLSIMARKEDFGGILFDRLNDRIYKVNVPGYELFEEVVAFHKKKSLAQFKSKKFKEEDIAQFISFLKGAGLWLT